MKSHEPQLTCQVQATGSWSEHSPLILKQSLPQQAIYEQLTPPTTFFISALVNAKALKLDKLMISKCLS